MQRIGSETDEKKHKKIIIINKANEWWETTEAVSPSPDELPCL